MQATKIPVVVEQSKQIDRPVLFTISAQVSFDGLFALIQALPKMQKWQIYQALGVELAPQSAEAKAIARLTDEEDESKWIAVVHEDDEIDEEALNEWLVKRGCKKAEV